jgi:hypothetical protein
MSRHHQRGQHRVMFDVRTMTVEELEEQYGLEVDPDDGSVWDTLEMKSFDDLNEWAVFASNREDEENSSFSKVGSRYAYDDEY